jgi:hypothetical protein
VERQRPAGLHRLGKSSQVSTVRVCESRKSVARCNSKPGRTCRYQVSAPAARTIAALLTLRDQIITPILAGIHSPRRGRKPTTWTRIDRDYETLRIGMQALFQDLGIAISPAAA